AAGRSGLRVELPRPPSRPHLRQHLLEGLTRRAVTSGRAGRQTGMMSVLRRVRVELERPYPSRAPSFGLGKGIVSILAISGLVLTGLSWIDYLHPRSFGDVVVAVDDFSGKDQPMRLVAFDK